jgi:hypothetical protein
MKFLLADHNRELTDDSLSIDSIYTERYMHRPQNNPEGYDNSTISDVAAMGENTRFLIMHGVADDNVHYQNTLTLLDKLNLQNIDNWDMVMYPDSDHSIFFHNAHRAVYERKFKPNALDAIDRELTFNTRLVELAHQRFQWRVAPHCQSKACGVILEAGQAICCQKTILHNVILIYLSIPLLLGGVIPGLHIFYTIKYFYALTGIPNSNNMNMFNYD